MLVHPPSSSLLLPPPPPPPSSSSSSLLLSHQSLFPSLLFIHPVCLPPPYRQGRSPVLKGDESGTSGVCACVRVCVRVCVCVRMMQAVRHEG